MKLNIPLSKDNAQTMSSSHQMPPKEGLRKIAQNTDFYFKKFSVYGNFK